MGLRFGTWAPTVPSSVPAALFLLTLWPPHPARRHQRGNRAPGGLSPPPGQCCGLGPLHFSSYVIVTLYLLILRITHLTKEAELLSPSLTGVCTVLTMSPGTNLDPMKVLGITGQSLPASPVFVFVCFFFSDCIAGRFWTHPRASDSTAGLHYSLVPWWRTSAQTPQ